MKVLVLGGTGAIGNYLIDILEKNNIETLVTSRRIQKNKSFVSYIKGNAKDYVFIKSLCNQHWDAIVDFMSYTTIEFSLRVNLLLNSTDQYIFISSARVYADEEHPIKENSPRLLDVIKDAKYLQTDEYALSKARQEDLLKQQKQKNYTIVRPYITFSENRLQLGVLEKEEWLYRAIHGRTIIFSKDIANRYTTMTNGYDVVMAIYNLIGNKTAIGEAFHITSPIKYTWDRILSIYLSSLELHTHIKTKIKYVSMDEFLSCRHSNLTYQVKYDRLYDRVFNTSKQDTIIESSKFIHPDVGLQKCIDSFLKKEKNFKTINWRYEAIKDKLTNEHTPLKEIAGIKNKLQYCFNRYIK